MRLSRSSEHSLSPRRNLSEDALRKLRFSFWMPVLSGSEWRFRDQRQYSAISIRRQAFSRINRNRAPRKKRSSLAANPQFYSLNEIQNEFKLGHYLMERANRTEAG